MEAPESEPNPDPTPEPSALSEDEVAFLRLAAVALADGVFRTEERACIERLRDCFGLTRRQAEHLLAEQRRAGSEVAELMASRGLHHDSHTEDLRMAIHVAFSDRRITRDEREVLERIASHCGLDRRHLNLMIKKERSTVRRLQAYSRRSVPKFILIGVALLLAGVALFFALQKGDGGGGVDEVFRALERRHLGSVVLIHTTYVMEHPNGGAVNLESWGTGFFVKDDGTLLTNKHVAMPWKFDGYPTRYLSRGFRYVEGSVEWSGYLHGTYIGPGSGGALGLGGSGRKDLEFLRALPDTMDPKGPSGRRYEVHDGDSTDDVACLRMLGTTGVAPLPLAPSTSHVSALDQLLVMGFPLGPGALDAARALHSSHLARVSKNEKTLKLDVPGVGGLSGSPVIDREGRVVGIVTPQERRQQSRHLHRLRRPPPLPPLRFLRDRQSTGPAPRSGPPAC